MDRDLQVLVAAATAHPADRPGVEVVAPDGQPGWRHNNEGPDDMSAHIRSALTQTSVGIPLVDGRLVLGTWQGLFLWEHRDRPYRREVVLHLLGE
mgnify:CR=1 FL=1